MPVISLTLSQVSFDNHSRAATCCLKGGHVNSLQCSFLWEIIDPVSQGRKKKMTLCVLIFTSVANERYSVLPQMNPENRFSIIQHLRTLSVPVCLLVVVLLVRCEAYSLFDVLPCVISAFGCKYLKTKTNLAGPCNGEVLFLIINTTWKYKGPLHKIFSYTLCHDSCFWNDNNRQSWFCDKIWPLSLLLERTATTFAVYWKTNSSAGLW